MKKQLLSLACMAALMPAVTANAASGTITEDWKAVHVDQSGENIYEGFAVGVKPCIRFATAMDGKIYVVNQKTNHIAEVTKNGIEDRYALPETMGKVTAVKGGNTNEIDDYYGTSLSRDDAGNFLVGHVFTYNQSSTLWTAFNPTTGAYKHFNTEGDFVPNNMNPGRIDCVGRVLGDLFNEAVVYVGPAAFSSNRPTGDDLTLWQRVQIISFMGQGAIASSSFGPQMYGASACASVAQPKFATIDDYNAKVRQEGMAPIDGCTYLSVAAGSGATDYTKDYYGYMYNFVNGGVGDVANMSGFNNYPNSSAFDTFELGGQRFYVMYYMPATADYANDWGTMNVGVFASNGELVASWENPDFKAPTSYGTIVAEPVDDKTVSICVYNCTARLGGAKYGEGVAVAAAKLTFVLKEGDGPDVTEPAYTGLGTETYPYVLYNSADICAIKDLVSNEHPTYFRLNNDVDMEGVAYIPAVGAGNSDFGKTIHFDGNNCVISNLTVNAEGVYYASLFGIFDGSVKNLGLENCNFTSGLGAGTFGAYLGYDGKPCVLDNVWASGEVKCTDGYAGGLGGNAAGPVTITNSYSRANVTAANYAGGLVGRVRANITVSNSYAGGSVSAPTAGGIIGNNDKGAAFDIVLKDVVAWNTSVDGATAADAVSVIAATKTNVLSSNVMTVNGAANEAGVSPSELGAAISGWAAFSEQTYMGMPGLKWQFVDRTPGSAANPYLIETADDLCNAWSKVKTGAVTYFKQTADIDMAGVEDFIAISGFNADYTACVNYDGQYHLIKNFAPKDRAVSVGSNDYYCTTLFGTFTGVIKNLGVVDADVTTSWFEAGILGGFAGVDAGSNKEFFPETIIDNVFVTGKVKGINGDAAACGTAGGMFGTTGLNVKIVNSYAQVEVSCQNGVAGGMIGKINTDVAFVNSYVSATVNGTNKGLVGTVAAGKKVTVDNMVAFGTGDAFNAATTGAATVAAPGDAAAIKTIQGWEAFNLKAMYNDLPALNWQSPDFGGVEDIVIDEAADAEVAPVYYNLSGVQVENPGPGLYIVKRGNKVTKEIIR